MAAVVEVAEQGPDGDMSPVAGDGLVSSSPSRQATNVSTSAASDETMIVISPTMGVDGVEDRQNQAPMQNGCDGEHTDQTVYPNGSFATPPVSAHYGGHVLAELCAKQAQRIAELERHFEVQRQNEAQERETRLIQEFREACRACERTRVECDARCEQMFVAQAQLQAENQELAAEMRNASSNIEALRREVQLLSGMVLGGVGSAGASPVPLARTCRGRLIEAEQSPTSGSASARQLKSPTASCSLPVTQSGPPVTTVPPWGPAAALAVVAAAEATAQVVDPGANSGCTFVATTNGNGTIQRHPGGYSIAAAAGYQVCNAEESGAAGATPMRSTSGRNCSAPVTNSPSSSTVRKVRHSGLTRGSSPVRIAAPPPSTNNPKMSTGRSSAASSSPRSSGTMSPRQKPPTIVNTGRLPGTNVPTYISSTMRPNQTSGSFIRSSSGKRSASTASITSNRQ